eukprot:scaffold4368_cov180-Ochromonas_danica.AAC.4
MLTGLVILLFLLVESQGFMPLHSNPILTSLSTTTKTSLARKLTNTALSAKKDKNKYKSTGQDPGPSKSERVSAQDKFNAVVRKFMFTIQDLNKVLPDGSRTILKNINLCFYPGAKIGVVGSNGSGKSSLLKIMAGVDKQFDGVAVPMPGASIGYLPQEPVLEGETVQENIDLGVLKGQEILNHYTELSHRLAEPLSDEEMSRLSDELEAVQAKIDAGDLWELDRVKARAMEALRCPPGDAKVSVLSGGERRRVALARLLLENHDLLLLDEPTNHLDAESVGWLERYLQEFKGTVVAITHDRYFLENSCQWILELDRGQGIPYEGNYSGWLEKKRQRMVDEKKADSRLQKTLEHELEWIRSNPTARQTKAKARLTRYEELLNTPAREVASSGSIYIPPGSRLGEVVIEAEGLVKGFGDRNLLNDVSFTIPAGAIVGIVGPNGAGKSTLLRMIQGLEKPDQGSLRLGNTVQIASVSQDRSEQLSSSLSVFDEISQGQDFITLGGIDVNSRVYCSWFGFKGGDQQKKVSVLSGGERSRCQMAKIVRSGANVLMLDEPSCVLVVSHDRYFLDRVCSHILAFEGDGKVCFYTGNYQDYATWRDGQLAAQGKPSASKPATYAKIK